MPFEKEQKIYGNVIKLYRRTNLLIFRYYHIAGAVVQFDKPLFHTLGIFGVHFFVNVRNTYGHYKLLE